MRVSDIEATKRSVGYPRGLLVLDALHLGSSAKRDGYGEIDYWRSATVSA